MSSFKRPFQRRCRRARRHFGASFTAHLCAVDRREPAGRQPATAGSDEIAWLTFHQLDFALGAAKHRARFGPDLRHATARQETYKHQEEKVAIHLSLTSIGRRDLAYGAYLTIHPASEDREWARDPIAPLSSLAAGPPRTDPDADRLCTGHNPSITPRESAARLPTRLARRRLLSLWETLGEPRSPLGLAE